MNNSACVASPWTSGDTVVAVGAAKVYGMLFRLTTITSTTDQYVLHDSADTAVENKLFSVTQTGNLLTGQQDIFATPIACTAGIMVTVTGTSTNLYSVLYK